ncbi:hypothetical protein Pfo_024880 [Paulownia fortunei]|nr:hypothetical protein Pfo_024880 [Paulownia fortunei]
MEHYTKRPSSLCNFSDEDTKTMQSPPRLSFKSHPQIYDHHHDNLLYSPSRSSTNSTNVYSLLPPLALTPHGHSPPTRPPPPQSSTTASPPSTAKMASFFPSPPPRVRAILAHGNTLFTSHKDCKVRVWNITAARENFQAKKINTLPKNRSIFMFHRTSSLKHKDCISCMAYNHAEGLLYTGSWDRTVKAWRISDNRCVDSFIAHEDHINAIVVNQSDGCVFTCSSDGSVKIWRRVYGQSSHTLTMTLKFQPSPVNALALSSSMSSCFLYSGSSDGFINFWEKEKMSGRFNHGGFLQGHRFSVLCLVAIEKLVFSGSEDTTIRVWRREEGSCFHECLAVLDAHRGPVKCLAASLEIEKVVVMGFLVYSAGLDQTFKVWRVKVLPEEKECPQGVEPIDTTTKITEYETSPVLSPSWVEKKLQGNNPFH